MSACTEVRMSTKESGWSYPPSFGEHLLEGHPSGRTLSAARGRSVVKVRHQLHNTRRDEQGRFNALAGGKPDYSPGFERDLERAVEGIVAYVASYAVSPMEIEAAIVRVEAVQPRAVQVLRWFQRPRKLRMPETVTALARQLSEEWLTDRRTGRRYRDQVDDRGVYRLKELAILGVWLELPANERAKAEQEQLEGERGA